jgi:hypothetical protein
MKIITPNKNQILSVLGLPHSGTTIVSNFLNSMNNGFCLSEPHWILLSNPKQLTFDKVKNLRFKNVNDILPSIKKKLNNDDKFDFGGVKETFRPQDKNIKRHLDIIANRSDILFFVFRNPKFLYNSFKKLAKNINRNPMPISRLIPDYNNLYEVVKETKDKAVIIKLEDFCRAGNKNITKFVNDKAKGKIKITGPFQLNKTNYKYGNNVANNSNTIKKPNTDLSLLSQSEIETINKELMPIYKAISKL